MAKARPNKANYRINNVSERHMVEEVSLKREQTMYQKGGSPCRTVRHYLAGALKKNLDRVQNKEERIVGLPKTPEEFQKLPSVLRDHYWYHKPDVQQMLRQFGFTTLKEIEETYDKKSPRGEVARSS